MIIAIDGPAGAGKSTVARGVAAALGFTYLDSGAMYRCVALATSRAGIDPGDAEAVAPLAAALRIEFEGPNVLVDSEDVSAGIDPGDAEAVAAHAAALRIKFEGPQVLVDSEDVTAAIREPGVSAVASRVSVHPGVREAMIARQRELIAAGSYVAEGRDIGTVVSPDAPLKVFLTADDAERARRRAAESGEPVERVLAEQRERDVRDREREHGALRAAGDSVTLDTTGLGLDEVVARVVDLARDRDLA